MKEGNKAYVKQSLSKLTDVDIFEKARVNAKASLEKLGIADLLQKHSMCRNLIINLAKRMKMKKRRKIVKRARKMMNF